MHLTPDILRACYAFLRETPPFRRWSLPTPEAITFRVLQSRDLYGQYEGSQGGHRIDVSTARISHTDVLTRTIAHEIIHLKTYLMHKSVTHGAEFERMKNLVCKYHGFDPKEL